MKKKSHDEFLPAKHLSNELEEMSSLLREIGDCYITRLESEIAAIKDSVDALVRSSKISPSCSKDVREMMDNIKSLQTKPAKGRRKDLKKIDDLIGELQNTVERW